jgi:2-dehydro-3-deoxy-D-arabinonate dehydratase
MNRLSRGGGQPMRRRLRPQEEQRTMAAKLKALGATNRPVEREQSMKLVKFRLPSGEEAIGLTQGHSLVPLSLPFESLSDLLESDDPAAAAHGKIDHRTSPLPLSEVTLLAPIDRQEVWAAGVTYKRSRKARMDESADAANFYDKVYTAPRPELFLKATPHRVAGPGEPVRIRQDTKWSVPEPELTLVLNSQLKLVGFTIGNDMSARDIEGENPLYLPQAKVYNGCCALGPCITLAGHMPPREETKIRLNIRRDNAVAFEGTTDLGQMARTYEDLIGWVARDNSFPQGVFLLTGTGIVPPDDFSLAAGDLVEITIDGIGTLSNPVVQG